MHSTPVVEFAGPPGAGKTTIARAALAELERLGLRCYGNESLVDRNVVRRRKSTRLSGKTRTLGRLVRGGVRHGRIALELARCIARTRSVSRAGLSRAASVLVLLDRIESIPAGSYDLVVLDQGLVQYIWSIFIAGDLPPDRDLRRLLAAIFSDVRVAVIFVQVDIDDAVSRIGARETQASRFDDLPAPQAREYLSAYGAVFDKIRCWSAKTPGVCSLDIDGSRPVSRNVARVVPFIAGLGQAGSRAAVEL
jgi:thymidylate kinase